MSPPTPEELALDAMSTRAEVYEWQAKILLAAIRSGKIPGVAWYPHGNAEASREMVAATVRGVDRDPLKSVRLLHSLINESLVHNPSLELLREGCRRLLVELEQK